MNQISVTLASSNPNVTFPAATCSSSRPVQKNGESTGSIRVAVNGAAGSEAVDFQIAMDAPELGLPGPLRVVSTHRVNYDDLPGASATATVRVASTAWTSHG